MAAKSKKYEELHTALIEDLKRRGLEDKIYTDKVEEYMSLWEQRQKLEKDIRKRGINVIDPKRDMLVENRSVSLEVMVSKQMLAIFASLGFREAACGATAKLPGDEDL